MGLFDELAPLFTRVIEGNLSPAETQAHYQQIASQTPPTTLAASIGPALSQLETGQVQQHIANSAGQMTGDQRGMLLQQLMSGLQGSGTDVPGLLAQLGVNPGVAQNPTTATPDEVAAVAAHAHQNAPGIFQEAMTFYGQHPTLVNAMGTLAVTQIMRHLSGR